MAATLRGDGHDPERPDGLAGVARRAKKTDGRAKRPLQRFGYSLEAVMDSPATMFGNRTLVYSVDCGRGQKEEADCWPIHDSFRLGCRRNMVLAGTALGHGDFGQCAIFVHCGLSMACHDNVVALHCGGNGFERSGRDGPLRVEQGFIAQ